MIDIPTKIRSVDLPYSLVFYEVSEEMFDELVDEDTKAELIDGVMIVHSPASLRHDDVANFLRRLMSDYVEEKELGIILGPDGLVRLRPGRKFGPDIFFLARERVARPLPKQWEGTPDMVVEILSLSNRQYDLGKKRSRYHTAGVKEIWFVDLDNKVVIQDLPRQRRYVKKKISTGTVASKALPGFWINVDWLWQEPLPKKAACLKQVLGKKE